MLRPALEMGHAAGPLRRQPAEREHNGERGEAGTEGQAPEKAKADAANP